MKSKKFKLIVFFAGILIFCILGCSKNKSTQINKTRTIQNSEITMMIERFKKEMRSKLKIDREISLDCTIFYLEASLNETYTRADYSKSQLFTDSTFVEIPLTENSTIMLSSMNDAYTILVENLANHYQSVTGEKSLIFVDVSIHSIEKTEITIKMEDYILASTFNPPNEWVFDSTEYWYWGIGLGKCGSYSGYTGQDAATQLQIYANGPLTPPSSIFYINVSFTPYIYPSDVPSSGNPYGFDDFLLFREHGNNPLENQCLSPDAMNYYLDNLKTIASMNQPYGKSIILYDCHSTLMGGIGYWDHDHVTKIWYGIPVAASGPPSSL